MCELCCREGNSSFTADFTNAVGGSLMSVYIVFVKNTVVFTAVTYVLFVVISNKAGKRIDAPFVFLRKWLHDHF